jgi:pimeloyl-ACP methyl ester carboxylesterase
MLSRRNTVLRYDIRGCGMSDRDVWDFSTDRLYEDFEAVVSAANIDQFVFFGTAGNVAPGVRFAVQHPGRVSHLVLYGCHTRGRLVRPHAAEEADEAETRLKAMELGWLNRNAAFGEFFAALHAPDELQEGLPLSELLRLTTSPVNAISLIRSYWTLDLRELLPRVQCPTLVIHARRDKIVPLEEGRLAAALVPQAKLVTLDSRNHILQEREPAWGTFVQALEDFIPRSGSTASLAALLTAREYQVLNAVAQGLDNEAIATDLRLSSKTVRNHVSTILSKLGAKTRAQAVAMARDSGLGGSGK